MSHKINLNPEIIPKSNFTPEDFGRWFIMISFGFETTEGISPNKIFRILSAAARINEENLSDFVPVSDTDIFLRDETGLWLIGRKDHDSIFSGGSPFDNSRFFECSLYESPGFKALVKAGIALTLSQNEIAQYKGEPILLWTLLPFMDRRIEPDSLNRLFAGNYDFEMRIGNGDFQRYGFSISPDHVFNMAPSIKKEMVHDAGMPTCDVYGDPDTGHKMEEKS